MASSANYSRLNVDTYNSAALAKTNSAAAFKNYRQQSSLGGHHQLQSHIDPKDSTGYRGEPESDSKYVGS